MRPRVEGHEAHAVAAWEAAPCAPDAHAGPGAIDGLDWRPASVPGTAAGALRAAAEWAPGDPHDFDAEDWWFRARLSAAPPAPGEELVLCLDGIATVAEVFLDDRPILDSDSMFAGHAVDVGALVAGEHELTVRCRALGPLLAAPRRPRARWRTKVVAHRNLRFVRTMILGRAPGFAPGPAAVGPWRPVRLERRRGLAVDELSLRPRLEGDDGVLAVTARLRGLDGVAPAAAEVRLDGPSGAHAAALTLAREGAVAVAHGELRVPGVARWWPHTHGDPVLHGVALAVAVGDAEIAVAARPTGFRALMARPDAAEEGLALRLNGVDVFARGAVWTPPDPVGLAPDEPELRATLERAREAGMNMVRVVGTAAYESEAFHDLCDELGMLVWQDLMFANLDYPLADDHFRATVTDEIRSVAGRLAGRPSVAVLCGNSEVEQQVGMLGLDPALGRGELFGELAPGLAAEGGLDAVYLPSSPCGGTFPFRPDRGVTHYFGVGAYRRGLDDARRAEPRFVSECLAFANVGEGDTAAEPGSPGVPRDAGVAWDFADVRDHYLADLHGVDPVDLRFTDPERYLELSRSVTGEVMAEVMGEWRRAGSPCRGALLLWLRDLAPGPGWGVLDHRGRPKAAYHHVRRALAPVAVWTTDEGLGGIRIHVANDGPVRLDARLRVALYAGGERLVADGEEAIGVGAHGVAERDVEAVLGHFADASVAYRFGPAAHDAVLVALETPAGELLGRTLRFPAGRPGGPADADGDPGLAASAVPEADGVWRLTVRTRRLAYGVRIAGELLWSSDDAFSLEPGGEHVVRLRREDGGAPDGLSLTALNLRGTVPIEVAP